jgi:hypothetical protein
MRGVMACCAAALVLAGCTTSVAGTAHRVPEREKLSCPPGAVTATAGPFCYPLPKGFTDRTDVMAAEGGWKFQTLIEIDEENSIAAAADLLDVDSDTYDAGELAGVAEQQRITAGATYAATDASEFTPVTIDGARAFEQTVEYNSGYFSHALVVYRGRTYARIDCVYVGEKETVLDACDEVIANFQIIDLPRGG